MNTIARTMNVGHLRSPLFDASFIFLIPLVAVIGGLLSHVDIEYFQLILVLDLWVLGYHHVIATYTRLAFDRDGFEDKTFLILYLPVLVALTVGLIAWSIGVVAVATIYLHWQWYHYTRQSEGISKAYAIKSGTEASKQTHFDRVVFYLVPIVCFLDMSSNQPETFLTMDVWVIPINSEVSNVLLIVTALVFLIWFVKKTNLAIRKEISISYYSYLISHYLIYYIAYAYIDNVNYGWIVINVWHNAQYIAFVWLYNTNKYGTIEDSSNPFLFLARPSNAVLYFLGCFAVSSAIYFSIEKLGEGLPFYVLIVIYQTLNFHHYIVDSKIWKLRKRPIQETLKLKGQI